MALDVKGFVDGCTKRKEGCLRAVESADVNFLGPVLAAWLPRASPKPDGDKIMRLHAQTATIENSFVHLPETAHWLADYLRELTLFPASRCDDQVDSTAQALAWTKI